MEGWGWEQKHHRVLRATRGTIAFTGLLCDETLASVRVNCSQEHATQDPSQLERVQDDHSRAVLGSCREHEDEITCKTPPAALRIPARAHKIGQALFLTYARYHMFAYLLNICLLGVCVCVCVI